MKGIYKGPQHYWNEYSLVPREKYYYGYYGMYGPWVDPKMYKPIEDDAVLNVTNDGVVEGMCNYSNDCEGGSFWAVICCVIIAWIFLKLLRIF